MFVLNILSVTYTSVTCREYEAGLSRKDRMVGCPCP